MTRSIGKPPKFNSNDELRESIEEYFNSTSDDKITITGIAIHLGFQSRQSFYDYGNKEEYAYTIKRTRLFIENEYEQSLRSGENNTASIFALKNFGWSDRQDINQTVQSDIKISPKHDLSKLSPTELNTFELLAEKAQSDL